MKIRTGIEKLGKGMLLLIFSIFTIFPFVWMILSALKTKAEIMDVRSFFPAEFQWHNFYQVIFESPLLRYVGNSLFVSVITLALQIVTGAMIAYAIVFMNFKGKKALFAVIMGTYMLPTAATYIPSYIILANWNLLNTFTGLIISNCVSIFGIFLLRQAFMQVPMGLIEAARIDGMSEYQIYGKIMLPLAKPALSTLTIFTFVNTWNDFLGPLIYLKTESKKTLQIGLRMFIGQNSSEYGLIMAASVLSLIPVLVVFLALQKYFVEGIAATGVKG